MLFLLHTPAQHDYRLPRPSREQEVRICVRGAGGGEGEHGLVGEAAHEEVGELGVEGGEGDGGVGGDPGGGVGGVGGGDEAVEGGGEVVAGLGHGWTCFVLCGLGFWRDVEAREDLGSSVQGFCRRKGTGSFRAAVPILGWSIRGQVSS